MKSFEIKQGVSTDKSDFTLFENEPPTIKIVMKTPPENVSKQKKLESNVTKYFRNNAFGNPAEF